MTTVIDRARRAPVHLPWLVIAGALAAGACGGGQKSLAPGYSSEKRAEIRTLWAEIERMEQGGEAAGGDVCGGAAADAEAEYGGDDKSSAADDVDDIESMSVPTSPRVAADAERPQARSAMPRRRDMCHQSRADRPSRCADVCRLAESICDNAIRICHLADELGGDAWAHERCEAASASCVRADARCCGCDQ